jgi:hypothetical protein
VATSGTYGFDLTLEEIVEEAYDRCGLRARSGYDYTTAIRSLNLLLIEWNNKGTNFWALDETSTSLSASTATLVLPTNMFEVIEFQIRTGSGVNQVDLPVTRISVSEWTNIPNKNTEGRPVNVWVDKQQSGITLHFWPTPDQAYSLVYWGLSRIEDAGAPASNTADVPYRFLPALVAGLAAKIAEKKVTDVNKVMKMQMDAELTWQDAVAGDRDRASMRFRPWMKAV